MLVTIINGEANKRTVPTPFYFKQDKGYFQEYTMVDNDGNVNTIITTNEDKSYLQINTRKLRSEHLIVAPYTHNLIKFIDADEYNRVIDQAQVKLHLFLVRIQKQKANHHESAH